jgi:MoaA/NifB/PqqE/SkfB family radical SAM enzyme
MKLSLLFRGLLTSCNYACRYCPFAKRIESAARLNRDRQSVQRFTHWIADQSIHDWKILFTPWGEALVRNWYRKAVALLTHVPHVTSVAVQTNLSCGLDWIEECRPERLAFWATYHPQEADSALFLRKVLYLHERGVRLSVGMVGIPEFFDQIAAMRCALPPDVYLWINAQQPRPRPYTPDERSFLSAIDPQFELTAKRQRSLGKPCRTGQAAFTVDGQGSMRRCHFVDEIIGNIFEPNWEESLQIRLCPNRYCNCFLGKAQLAADSLAPFFGEQLLERIPDIAFQKDKSI